MGGIRCGVGCRPTYFLERMSLLPKQIGDIGESACITRLLMMGYEVLVPVGDRLPYDLVYVVEGKFIRAQVKVAWRRHGSIVFNSRYRNGKPYVDIDVFLVYFQGRVFKIPSNLVTKQQTYLRISGKRRKDTLKAARYELLPKAKRWQNSIKQE